MKRVCYGESNISYVIRSNGDYIDKTRFIEKLVEAWLRVALFLEASAVW